MKHIVAFLQHFNIIAKTSEIPCLFVTFLIQILSHILHSGVKIN